MSALRELKPYYRHDRSVLKQFTPPQPTDVELVLNPVEDTTLHYAGSPLMHPDIVLDPETLNVVPGFETNYKTQPWIAVGLATDNTEGATDATVEAGIGDSPVGEPLDGSGGIHQPPTNGSVNYTSVGPARSALFFDLSGIPSDAIITEAVLELVPYDSDAGDIFGEETVENVWPSVGVNLEILNLPQDATENATWNTKDGSSIIVPFDNSAGQSVVPEPSKRWWRTVGGILPPNPIGLAQNTRRSDIAEPADLFENQINSANYSTTGSNTIDGDPGDPEEYYGHIGYGISGGGYAVNIDPANPSAGHPTFNIDKSAWDSQQENTQTNEYSVPVLNEVTWANETGNRQCNFLIRASNWLNNTAAQTSDDQLTFPNNEPFIPVSLSTAHISLSPGGEETAVADTNDTLHVVDDAAGDPLTVEYIWQIQTPYVAFDTPVFDMNFAQSDRVEEGDTLELNSYEIRRGGEVDPLSNDSLLLEYLLAGSVVNSFSWFHRDGAPDTSFVIPQNTEGDNLRVKLTVENTNPDTGILDTKTTELNFGNIKSDAGGDVSISIDGNPTTVSEESDITARAIGTNVVNPEFSFELRFPDSATIHASTPFSSSDTATFTIPQVGSGGGQFRVRVVMRDSEGEEVDTALTSEVAIENLPDVGQPNQMKFQYVEDRLSEADPFGNVDTFTTKSGTQGLNFTDSVGQFPTETTESGGDFDVAGVSFSDLNNPDGADVGAIVRLTFDGTTLAQRRAQAQRWGEHFIGIQLTIRNSSGSVVSTHIFSGEGDTTFGYGVDNIEQGVVVWRNTSLGQSPNIPTPSEMRTIRDNIFDNSTQNDNPTANTVFGESEFFFDIDYIPIPTTGGGGDGPVVELFGTPSDPGGSFNAANSGSVIFEADTDNITAHGLMFYKITAPPLRIANNPSDAYDGYILTEDEVEFFDFTNMEDLNLEGLDIPGVMLINGIRAPQENEDSGSGQNVQSYWEGLRYTTTSTDFIPVYAYSFDGPSGNMPEWRFNKGPIGDPQFTGTPALPDLTVFNLGFPKQIGSGQQFVVEIIRDGVVIGRSKMNRNGGQDVSFGYKQYGSYRDWYSGEKWQVGDKIAFMVIDSSRSFDQFKVS